MFPMPTFEFREWLAGLAVAVVICFALTPLAARGARGLRPFAWLYAVIHFLNAMGHTVATILGHTVVRSRFRDRHRDSILLLFCLSDRCG